MFSVFQSYNSKTSLNYPPKCNLSSVFVSFSLNLLVDLLHFSLLQILPKCWQEGVQTKTFLSWVSASFAALQRTSLSSGILFATESVLNLCLLTFQEQSFEIHTGSAAVLLSVSPSCPVALCAHSVLHTSTVPDSSSGCSSIRSS